MNERRNNIPSETPSTFNWIFEESVEYPREQDFGLFSDQDFDTGSHLETEWETDTASNAEAGQEESPEAYDDDGTGWETGSDEKFGEEVSLEVSEDMEVGWGTELDSESSESPLISKDSTQNDRQWRYWDSFVDWLKSDLPVYWITGKPGSGKSTLMKFLISDSRTLAALKEWRKDAIIITHFFLETRQYDATFF